jgi:hypothetical protein
LFRDDPIVLQQMLQRPEGELCVVGRDTDRTTAGISIRLVVADVTSAPWKLPFGRVPERVADRQAEQHAFDAVERHEAERRRRAERGERAGREAEPALCDQLVEHGFDTRISRIVVSSCRWV